MAVMDEFKEERENIKNQPFKKRLAYFWGYYKWYVLGGIFAIIVLTFFIRDLTGRKEDALYGIVVNGHSLSEDEPLARGFEEYAGIDTDKYTVSINSSLFIHDTIDETGITSGQFITVYMAAGDLDVSIMDTGNFEKYAYAGNFQDLSAHLDSSLLEKLADRIYYIDYAVMEELDRRQEENLSTDDIVYPDPYDPANMEKPIPVGIDLTGCRKFFDAYYYEDGTAFLGISVNSKSPDMAARFIDYLFAEE